MTRQSRARWLAFATALLVVLLAALFAWLRNLPPAPPAGAVDAPKVSGARDEPGRAAFVRAGCSGCHSAEGRGNPALPLDGVGARLDREALRDAAFALGSIAERTSRRPWWNASAPVPPTRTPRRCSTTCST